MGRTVTLSILDRIEIASPCPASWDDMEGDDRSRFCGQCRKNVYNIAAMTRSQAEALIAATEGSACLRLFRRADGTVLTSDCPVGVRALRRAAAAGLARIAAIGTLALGTLLAVGGAKAASVRVRQLRPLASICEWLSPTPVAVGRPVMMGAVMIPQGGR